MFGEKLTAHVAWSDGWHRHPEAPKREAPGMHPVHTKWWARMHRVHTELVEPTSGKMMWDNCLFEFFLLEKVYIPPSPTKGWLHNSLNYEMVYITPELSKTGQITP